MDDLRQSPPQGASSLPERAVPGDDGPGPHVERGTCYVLFAWDIGLAVNLNEVERRVSESSRRQSIRSKRHAPAYFEYDPPPVQVSLGIQPLMIGRYRTTDSLDALLYDFGAISITYRIELNGPMSDLVGLSYELYDNEELAACARRHVEQLLAAVAPAVSRPQVSAFAEDYVIYELESLTPALRGEDTVRGHRRLLAQMLRSERDPLSDEEINDALLCHLSFGQDDIGLIDWNAAMVFNVDADDVRGVLEYANVELLEMRFLDSQLDAALDESYGALTRSPSTLQLLWTSYSSRLRRVAELQMDGALLFENVNNALKLLGDQYLARVYRAASQRMRLDDWDASIIRKLKVLDSIYAKLSDQVSNRRLELLEWIIIVLIALSTLVSVVLSLVWH